jgi:transposase-like protein
LKRLDFKELSMEEVLEREGLIKRLTGRILRRVSETGMDSTRGTRSTMRREMTWGTAETATPQDHIDGKPGAVIRVLRNRNGIFEPKIIRKHHKHLPLFNDRIISIYLFGVTERDIKAHLEKSYNVKVSPEPASRVTDAVMEEIYVAESDSVFLPSPDNS